MRSGWCSLAIAAVAGAILLLGRPRPVEAAEAAPTAGRLIEIVIAGPDESYEALVSALGPLLQSEEGVRLRRAARADGGSGAKAGIWIEAGKKGTVRIVVFSENGHGVERQINGRELTPVTAEIVAQITHDAARGLLAEEAGDPSRADEPAPRTDPPPHRVTELGPPQSAGAVASSLREPAAPGPRDERFALVVDVGYATRLIFDPQLVFCCHPTSHTQQGIAGAVTVISHHPRRNAFLSLMVDETWAGTPPVGANVGVPALDITTFSGRVLAGLAWRPARHFDVGLGVGVGADHLQAKAGITGAGSAWLMGARAALRLAILVPSTSLEVWGMLTVDTRSRAMFALSPPMGTPGTTFTFYNTAPIQPGVGLGIGWRL